MKIETIEKYLDKIGISPGPWLKGIAMQYGKRHYGVVNKDYDIALCGDMDDPWEKESGEANMNVLVASRDMLVMLFDCAFTFEFYAKEHRKKHGVGNEKYQRNRLMFEATIENLEQALSRPWEEIRKELEEMEE
ncbi:MAG: hypothetical protein PQJ59_16850 [Spirochaetales bacterium]|nr:hypothetical protein [Spirochaetales bacterium]